MAYATAEDVQRRMTTSLSDAQMEVCAVLLDDAAVLIDASAPNASEEAKFTASCSMVIRALGSSGSVGIPVGATQGSASALGYSQSWTIGNGASGELYLSKSEKKLLGIANRIGSYSPIETLEVVR